MSRMLEKFMAPHRPGQLANPFDRHGPYLCVSTRPENFQGTDHITPSESGNEFERSPTAPKPVGQSLP